MTMDDITKMATRSGFVEVFWCRLQGLRRIGRQDTARQIYDKMEQEHEEKYGIERFPSYEAFRKFKDRHR